MAPDFPYDDELHAYRTRRDPEQTPEPFGRRAPERDSGARRFVVQLHAARRRHYDLRLELGGALVSWAVPRGPSLDPADRRLAVRVEDHPLEYARFEGVIPQGNYGAGPVVVWDMGSFTPVEDPIAGMAAGKLVFDLKGYKLRGRFSLVRKGRAGDDREWLLIKVPDAYADPARELGDESVLSGLTVEELRRGHDRGAQVTADLERMGAPRGVVDVRSVSPMLASTAEEPFTDSDWVFELKYDGYRLLAGRDGAGVCLRYRSGADATHVFPEIAHAVAALPFDSFVIDGEVVVLGDDGRPVFHRLQQRTQLRAAPEIERAATLHPATLMVFDLLAFNGFDLRVLPLLARKRVLERLAPRLGPLRFADHIVARGEEMFEAVVARGLEGIVAKRVDAPYLGQRSELWKKIRTERVADFAVLGYTSPLGSRAGFGSLHLGVRDQGTWRYAGRVGAGFGQRDLDELAGRLAALPPWTPPFSPPSSPQREDHWVEPRLVVTVKYQDWRPGGLLRISRFLYLRDDKAAEECQPPWSQPQATLPASHADEPGTAPDMPAAETRAPVAFSNQDKIFFPASEGRRAYTKGDLIDYYRRIAPWILPYLRDRPVVLIRYPDGIDGPCFFQKDAPVWVPSWIRTEALWSKHSEREIRYVVCDDLDALLYVINLGSIPLHVWSSRVASLTRPDWSVIDLDPKGAPFAHVVTLARALRHLCEGIGLPSFIKTSGQAGLHVHIPLGRMVSYDQSRQIAHLLARIIEADHPDIATTARSLERRGGRVYIDTVQNAHGRLIAAPFSARPRPGAPVSMPLGWREVEASLDPARHTIENAAARMQRLGRDPFVDVLDLRPDLRQVLERLSERVARLA